MGCCSKKRKVLEQNIGGKLVNLTTSKEITQLPLKRSKGKSESTNVADLPSTIEELHDELMKLFDQLKVGNPSVRTRIIAILKKMREHGVLSRKECAKACAKILHNDSESEDSSTEDSETGTDQSTDSDSKVNEKSSSQESESDQDEKSSDSGREDDEFNQFIRNVADNLVQNARKNLLHTLLAVTTNERKQIESWLEGAESIEKIIPLLKDSEDMLKIKILMKQIDEKRKKVDKVLRPLRNVTDHGELKKILDELKSRDVITEDEYKRLIIANHDLKSFARAFQGSGIWV